MSRVPTTRKSTTRETPFALAFSTEEVAPIEIGLKSPRIELASVDQNEEALRLNLNLLDEKREQVLQRTEDYQRKTTRYYNQKVKPRSYKEKSDTWKTRALLGGPLYSISHRQTG